VYQTLLVPLDGSEAAEIVVPYVAYIGAKLGSNVILVTVSESAHPDLDHLYRTYLEQIRERVRILLKSRGIEEPSRVSSSVLLGNPADQILSYADESGADLVIMASRGSSGHGPWLLGSIAAKVLRASLKPVLLIRAPIDSSAEGQGKIFRRILVPLDGSPAGEAALPYVQAIAKALDAELVLYDALEPVTTLAAYGAGASVAIPQSYFESVKDSASVYLESVRKRLSQQGIVATTEVQDGRPADLILEYAQSKDIDMIAMSTHGRSGVGRWVFGSVTDKVLHSGDTPVLVVRA